MYVHVFWCFISKFLILLSTLLDILYKFRTICQICITRCSANAILFNKSSYRGWTPVFDRMNWLEKFVKVLFSTTLSMICFTSKSRSKILSFYLENSFISHALERFKGKLLYLRYIKCFRDTRDAIPWPRVDSLGRRFGLYILK